MASSGLNLITAALMAPLTGLQPGAGTGLLHAVTQKSLIHGWDESAGFVSACGLPVKLIDVPLGSHEAVPWPPEVKSLPPKLSRCVACHKATGRKRPRCHFAKPELATNQSLPGDN